MESKMRATKTLQVGATANAIQYHYDVSDDFYKLWLDPTLTYSCPLWEGDEKLEQAQIKKYDYHTTQSQAKGKARVIDIGCGWGGFVKRLSQISPDSQITALTLSATQLRHIQSLSLPKITARLESWADHQPDQPYDAAISIGAFEHFAKYGIGQTEKITSYRKFFEKMHMILAPGARLSLQTMAYGSIPRGATHKDLFVANEIFPESDFPRLADIGEASEMLFEVEFMRNDRMHYARAYRAWFDSLCASEEQAVALVGREVFDRYKRYLRLFSYSFEMGAFELLRLTLRRIDGRHKR
jgi:cyclopropane-fatty-acyl-phospholipid synthase